ncbi:MAG: OmpA family protein [Verrucomicrobiota bacterium]
MEATDYSWKNMKRTRYRTFRNRSRFVGYVFLAILLAAAIHFGLWVWFNILQVPVGMKYQIYQLSPAFTTQPTIDASGMSRQESEQETQTAASLGAEEIVTEVEELDLIDIQQILPERETVLSPEVSQPENFLDSPSVTASTESFADAMSEMSEQAQQELDRQLEDAAAALKPQASDQQMLLDSLPTGTNPDEYLENLAKQGSGSNASALQGYTNLGDLLNGEAGADRGKPILMPTDLLFGYNEWELRESAKVSMMMLGLLIERNPKTLFLIDGHTDTFGGEPYNLELSRKRAQAVKDWLVQSLQINPRRIVARGRGESSPIASPTGGVQEQALNRRVEITMREPQ